MRHSDEVNDFLKPRIRLLEGLSDPIRRRPSYSSCEVKRGSECTCLVSYFVQRNLIAVSERIGFVRGTLLASISSSGYAFAICNAKALTHFLFLHMTYDYAVSEEFITKHSKEAIASNFKELNCFGDTRRQHLLCKVPLRDHADTIWTSVKFTRYRNWDEVQPSGKQHKAVYDANLEVGKTNLVIAQAPLVSGMRQLYRIRFRSFIFRGFMTPSKQIVRICNVPSLSDVCVGMLLMAAYALEKVYKPSQLYSKLDQPRD
ncbi:hypothetical protein ABG067_007441 [Albugo candida]